jgi:hypothetical protein
MRKLLAAGIVGLLLAVGAVVALAQSSPTAVTVQATVTPNKAGTKRHPQGVKLDIKVHWNTAGSAQQPIVQTATTLFPKGSLYNGGKFPSCSEATLNNRGTAACPAGSIMGAGTGDAFADTTITHPQITVVNGGASRVYLYTILNNPARVQAPVPGVITKMSGQWAYKLVFTVPQVLQVVAGVPIQLTYIDIHAGRGDWLATTGCGPGGHWPFSLLTTYDTGAPSGVVSSTPCRK